MGVGMFTILGMIMTMPMAMGVLVGMDVPSLHLGPGTSAVCREMNIKLDAFNPRFLPTGHVQVVSVESQSLESPFEGCSGNTQVQQCPDEHVAADPAEEVEVEDWHGLQSQRSMKKPLLGRQSPHGLHQAFEPLAILDKIKPQSII